MEGKGVHPHPDQVISALASRQYGVVGVAQLRNEGVGWGAIEHRVSARRLHRVHRGVYSPLEPRLLRVQGHWLAAVLACGPGAVLSHTAAAVHWDLRRSSASAVDVTVPRVGGRRTRGGIRLHRSSTLDTSQATTHAGIPITTVARTLIDLADRLDTRAAELATGQAEVLRLFDLEQLEAAIEANPGRRGSAVMRRILDAHLVGAGLTESELEDEFLRLCERFGIPRPDTQVQLGPDRVDFLWRTEGLVVETDGWRWHGGRSAWESDRRRDIRLQRLGLRVARFSYARVLSEPKGVADDLKDLLSAGPSGELRRAG